MQTGVRGGARSRRPYGRRPGRFRWHALGATLLVLPLAGLGLYPWTATRMAVQQAARWPSVTGTIVASRLDSRRPGRGSARSFGPRIRYQYEVASRWYEGTRLGAFEEAVWSRDSARVEAERLAEWAVGRTVRVYYDPTDSSRAVVDPLRTDPRRVRGMLFVAAVTFLAAVGLVWWFW